MATTIEVDSNAIVGCNCKPQACAVISRVGKLFTCFIWYICIYTQDNTYVVIDIDIINHWNNVLIVQRDQ